MGIGTNLKTEGIERASDWNNHLRNELMMKQFWNQRYEQAEYVYGVEPNGFFRAFIESTSPAKLLLPAEGEGRNAVFAASKGWQVDAFDYSESGRQKALALAERHDVQINYFIASYDDVALTENSYDVIALIYAHMPSQIRQQVHRKLLSYLKPGGVLLLEAFSKEQLQNQSGGPKNLAMLYSHDTLAEDFNGMNIVERSQDILSLDEGAHHRGKASVVRLIATKK
jgi:2-polyprenyl-3-methyl-5-hydroxy-6-metoxy-1,4-benzoquinol methylase